MSESTPDGTNRFEGVTIASGETFPATLDCFGICANYWEANEQYDPGEYRWPTTPNGFVLQVTSVTSVRSGAKEPVTRGKAAGDTVIDGSVEWTLRVPTNDTGIQPITSVEIVDAPVGITVGQPIISENTKLLVDYSSAAVDQEFDVVFAFTVGGRRRIGRQEVNVAEK